MELSGDAWRPSATISTLRHRSKVLQRLREFFREHGYWEVETPLLSRDICIDVAIDPFAVEGRERMYLQTSPEFALKRLLCAGADGIFEVTRSFRQDESGHWHNPEFTIVEWYRNGVTYREQMQFVQELVKMLVDHAISEVGEAPERLRATSFIRLTYEEAFVRFTGGSALSASVAELAARARSLGIVIPQSLEADERDGWLNLLLAEVVEPRLAELGAVFLHDYPESQSAIARVRPGQPPVAERFELYLDGIEICNGYQELTDPDELYRRMEQRNETRIRFGKPPLPADSRLLEAMRLHGLPECTGVALGFDRLVAWLLGKSGIAEVMSFYGERA